MSALGFPVIAIRSVISISGLVAGYIVAVDVTRYWFLADAYRQAAPRSDDSPALLQLDPHGRTANKTLCPSCLMDSSSTSASCMGSNTTGVIFTTPESRRAHAQYAETRDRTGDLQILSLRRLDLRYRGCVGRGWQMAGARDVPVGVGRGDSPRNAAGEDRTHDLRIMRPGICQLRYCARGAPATSASASGQDRAGHLQHARLTSWPLDHRCPRHKAAHSQSLLAILSMKC